MTSNTEMQPISLFFRLGGQRLESKKIKASLMYNYPVLLMKKKRHFAAVRVFLASFAEANFFSLSIIGSG